MINPYAHHKWLRVQILLNPMRKIKSLIFNVSIFALKFPIHYLK